MGVRAALLALALPLVALPSWRVRAPVPLPRTEVAAAALGTLIAIVGGLVADGSATARVDVYRTASDSWWGLPDLPAAVHHAAATTLGGRLVVVGGYGAPRNAWVLAGGVWRALPRPPASRAAAGAAVLGGRLYVVGGVADGKPVRNALEYDARRSRWRAVARPTPREHLAVVTAARRIYAIGGPAARYAPNGATGAAWRPGRAPRGRRAPPAR